jgi:hypothetical protein
VRILIDSRTKGYSDRYGISIDISTTIYVEFGEKKDVLGLKINYISDEDI